MNILNIIRLKYPNATLFSDYLLQDDGAGAYIKEWNIAGVSKPTKAQLQQWSQDLDLPLRQQEITKKRVEEYNKQGVTIENMIVAIWERLVENRPELANELQTKRAAIKAAYPKPTA